MIEASGEEGGSDETEPPTECPAHKTTVAARGVMTDNEVAENSMLFLLAGLDTTASLISYSCYQLALHPDIQEKLQSEIDTYFEDKQESNLYAAAQEIDYLDNVIQEILRLHPPAPEIDRYCKQTTVISGVTIPEGVTVTVPIALLHYSPLYWKDPEKFDPDRFIAEEKATRPQLCHMPFGFGPRSCIGMRLALLEAKIALIELLKRYTFTRAPETEVPLLEVGVVLKPKNGVYLKVIERSQL